MILHDISVILGEQSIAYPGDPVFARETLGGESGEAMKLTMCAHSGTHLDAPAHFFPEGRHLDDYALADFVLPAQVVEILDPQAVTAADLAGVETSPGEAVLFRTGNSHSGRAISGQFSDRYVYLDAEAAAWCVDRQLKLVGLDYISVDDYANRAAPAHHLLLEEGVLLLEGINLAEVRPGRYTLMCFPLRIKGAEGSPVRAVLIEGSGGL